MSEYVLKIRDREYRAELKEITPDQAKVVVDGTEYEVDLVEIGRRDSPVAKVSRPPSSPARTAPAPETRSPKPRNGGGLGNVRAPLPGLILSVHVKEGATVQAGETLVVMEAMKMENEVKAPNDGTVRKVYVAEGDNVGESDPLVEVIRPEMTTL